MDVTALRAYLDERAAKDEFSGVVRIERADGDPVFEEAHGLASRTWQVANTPGTRFDCASVTKLFTAVATLQQVQAGAFDLDTSAIGYLGLAGTSIVPEVTPYHLLTHTSGIADDADEEAGEAYEDVFVDRPTYSIRETSDIVPTFADKPPNFPPGQGCRYCNCAYVVLGLMIERATGLPYREYVVANVFRPAGMARSGFFRMDGVEPDVAEGIDPLLGDDGTVTGWRRNIYSYPPIGDPAGGAHVTAADLLSFHRALRGGLLLDGPKTDAVLSSKEDKHPSATGVHRTGFGFEFHETAAGVATYWKEGSNMGVSAMLRHYPTHGLTVAILANRQDAAWDPVDTIDRMLLGGDGHLD
jgi:CubicO group peptidase (beta-lactamase class C family)